MRHDDGNTPGRTRTCDRRFRKPMLYPAELRGQTLRIHTKLPLAVAARRRRRLPLEKRGAAVSENPTAKPRVRTGAAGKPEKPYPDFRGPPHASGARQKKIRGKDGRLRQLGAGRRRHARPRRRRRPTGADARNPDDLSSRLFHACKETTDPLVTKFGKNRRAADHRCSIQIRRATNGPSARTTKWDSSGNLLFVERDLRAPNSLSCRKASMHWTIALPSEIQPGGPPVARFS